MSLNESEHGPAGMATEEQGRFSPPASDFSHAADQELTHLQGRSGTGSKQQLDRAFEAARQALLATCQSLPAGLLAGHPLPFPTPHHSLDSYCAVADLPHSTPAQLTALLAAAQPAAPFRNTTRNRAISTALMQVSFAASNATSSATLPSALQKMQADSSMSKQPMFNLALALTTLRTACQ